MKSVRMSTLSTLVAVPFALILLAGTHAQDQHPILDGIATKVIQNYQSASCSDLQAKQAAKTPLGPQEQKAIQFLKNDPTARTYFINKVAPPIANKLFECGIIP